MSRVEHIDRSRGQSATAATRSSGADAVLSEGDRWFRSLVTWLPFAGGCFWALHLLMASRGVTTHDAIGHFVISREAWHRPELILHHWGRPIVTAVYMPATLGGLEVARLVTLILAALTALLTLRLGERLEVKYAFLIPLLYWFQPWVLLWSGEPSLSEFPFSLMLVLSALLLIERRFLPASLLIGFFTLVRNEAPALVVFWAAVCLLRKDWRSASVTLLPTTAYVVLYQWTFGRLPDGDFPIIPHIGTFVGPHSAMTPHPDLLHYPKLLAHGTSLFVAVLAACSVPLVVRSVPRLVVFLWFGVYLALHMAIFRIGIATSGEQRYVLPLAPAVALAAALGLGMLVDGVYALAERLLKARVVAKGFSYAFLTICAVVVLIPGFRIKPVPLDAGGAAAEAVAAWLRQQGLADGEIISTHVYLHYFLPGHLNALRPGREPEALWYRPGPLSGFPPGTIAIWDNQYSVEPGYGLSYSDLTSAAQQWRHLKEFNALIPGTWSSDDARFVVFQKGKP